MANTYVAIATTTVGSGGVNSIDFTSIPGTYTDLKIVLSSRNSRSSNGPGYIQMTLNSSSSNFTYRYIGQYHSGPGDTGGVVSSSGSANYISFADGIDAQTANSFGSNEIYITNYTSSNYKSISVDGTSATNGTYPIQQNLLAGLWSNSAAITSLSLIPGTSPFLQYSTATLYGIKNS